MAEGARLESVYTPKGYHEFESHRLRKMHQLKSHLWCDFLFSEKNTVRSNGMTAVLKLNFGAKIRHINANPYQNKKRTNATHNSAQSRFTFYFTQPLRLQ